MRVVLHKLSLLCLVAAPTLSAQRTLHIPADNPTIQSSIDAASAGDTLMVSPGVYLENLNLRGKAITIQSTEGPEVTVLDGQHLAPTVSFVNGETRSTTLAGFTIRNGAPDRNKPGSHGAGILLQAASPTLIGNTLADNLCAAIDATESAPLIQNNSMTKTRPDPACLAQAIAPVVLTGDPADPALAPTLTNNTVERNDFSGSATQPNAGGIALLAVRAVLQSNTIRFNTVPGDTSGALQILAQPSSPGRTPTLIQQNLIVGNTTRCGAAGISVTVLNDLSATSNESHLEVKLLSNTVADNVSGSSCGPFSQASEFAISQGTFAAQVLLVNNILSASSTHPALKCFLELPSSSLHHNLVHNSSGPEFSVGCPDPDGNLLADPQFLNPLGLDYHLVLHSPAVDAGDDGVSPMLDTDLDAAPRLRNATGRSTAVIDLGAYEYPAPEEQPTFTTTVLNATPSSSEAFQAVSLTAEVTSSQPITPGGSIVLTAVAPSRPPIVLATLPLDADGRVTFTTTSLPAANYTLSAAYGGTALLAKSSSGRILQAVRPATTLLAFSATPSEPSANQAIQLYASVSAPLSTHKPRGSVSFLDLAAPPGSALLGTAILDASGHTKLILPGLPAGVHRIGASYSGTQDFAPVILSAADALTLKINLRDYTQTLSSPTITLISSHHAPVDLTLTSLGSFADLISVSCRNLPEYASCSFSPRTTNLDGYSSKAIDVRIDTDAVPGFAQYRSEPGSLKVILTLAVLLPFSFLSWRTRHGVWKHSSHLGMLTLFIATLQLCGCGAGKYPGHTPPGIYKVDLITQAALSGITHVSRVNLIVTP